MSIDSSLERSASGSIHLPPPGTIIADRFRILEMVGRGGMGVVYRAEHIHLQKEMAVKMLLGDFERDGARFSTEARIASMLDHPNIVRVHDFGLLSNGYPYLAMDFLPGRSLDDELKQIVTLPLDRFRTVFLQVCDALEHAHQAGVVHRDIKPSNIMLVTKNRQADVVKIVDFGLVKVKSSSLSGSEQKLTSTNTLVGSPLFMSPEQCRGMELDNRSDVYSLGCVMYRALTGQLPIWGDNPLDTLYKHVSDPPLPMAKANPRANVPPQLECVVMKALCKTPDARQQSMEELRAELERALPGDPVEVLPSSSRHAVCSSAVAPQNVANVSKLRESAIFHTAAPTPPAGTKVEEKPKAAKRNALPVLLAVAGAFVLGAGFFAASVKQSSTPPPTRPVPAVSPVVATPPPVVAPKGVVAATPSPTTATPTPISPSTPKPKPKEKPASTPARKPVDPIVAYHLEDPKPAEIVDPLAFIRAGDAQLAQADFGEARRYYERALQLMDKKQPNSESSMPLLAKLVQTCVQMRDKPSTARNFLRFCECWTLYPENPIRENAEVMRHMANVAVLLSAEKLHSGDREHALTYMRWAYTFAGDDPSIRRMVNEQKLQLNMPGHFGGFGVGPTMMKKFPMRQKRAW